MNRICILILASIISAAPVTQTFTFTVTTTGAQAAVGGGWAFVNSSVPACNFSKSGAQAFGGTSLFFNPVGFAAGDTATYVANAPSFTVASTAVIASGAKVGFSMNLTCPSATKSITYTLAAGTLPTPSTPIYAGQVTFSGVGHILSAVGVAIMMLFL